MKTIWSVSLAVFFLFSSGALGRTVTLTGRSAFEWQTYSVLLAEVLKPRPLGRGGLKTVYRPIGTLSGRFDASEFSEVTAEFFNVGALHQRREVRGDTVLVVLLDQSTISEQTGYRLPSGDEYFTYMPEPGEGLDVVDRFSDPRVEATLKTIQEARKGEDARARTSGVLRRWKARQPRAEGYWSVHGVVFAEVKNVTGPNASEPLSKLVLLPKLTFAGAFDAGKTPEIAAAADLKKFGPAKPPAAGDKVLVVLERVGDTYRVAQELPEYMPKVRDQRSPICVVKDFTDPKVAELVKTLKDLRKRQRDEEAKKKRDEQGNTHGT